MPELSLSQAAKVTGKSKSTINRSIKTGKISATRHDDGSYSIDAAELARVFRTPPTTGSEWIGAAPNENPIRTALLEAEVAALKDRLAREAEIAADLMKERDAWKQQATALLAAPPKPRRWWPWGGK